MTRSGYDFREEGEENEGLVRKGVSNVDTSSEKEPSWMLSRYDATDDFWIRKTTRRLDEREGVLLARESLHHDCTKFEIFARENERKMQKSLKVRERISWNGWFGKRGSRGVEKGGDSLSGRRRCERKNRALSSVLQF